MFHVLAEQTNKMLRVHIQDVPLLVWLPLINDWLAELIRLEGYGSFTDSQCPSCG